MLNKVNRRAGIQAYPAYTPHSAQVQRNHHRIESIKRDYFFGSITIIEAKAQSKEAGFNMVKRTDAKRVSEWVWLRRSNRGYVNSGRQA